MSKACTLIGYLVDKDDQCLERFMTCVMKKQENIFHEVLRRLQNDTTYDRDTEGMLI